MFEQAQAACCTIHLDERPSPDLIIERIRSRRDEVLFVDCIDL